MTLVSAAMPCPSATNAVAPRAAGSGRVPGLLRKLPNLYGLHNQAPARLRLAVSRSSAGEGGARVDTEAFGDYTSTEFENRKVAEYVELFKLADTDNNGVLDKKELMKLLQSFEKGTSQTIQAWLEEEEMNELIKQYDVDESGSISIEEFTNMMRDEVLLDGKLEEYEAAFKAVDKTGNGTIGANELAEVFDSLGQPMSYTQLFRVMEKYDKDGSGQIDFSEFLRMFRDQLLDLQAVLDYVKMNPRDENIFAEGTMRLVNAEPGEVALIFSPAELDDLMEASPGKLTVLMASLTWCRPCKGFQKNYQKLADNYLACQFVKFYGNSNEKTKALFKDELKVKGTPSFYFFRDGNIVGQCSGANLKRLEDALRPLLTPGETPASQVA